VSTETFWTRPTVSNLMRRTFALVRRYRIGQTFVVITPASISQAARDRLHQRSADAGLQAGVPIWASDHGDLVAQASRSACSMASASSRSGRRQSYDMATIDRAARASGLLRTTARDLDHPVGQPSPSSRAAGMLGVRTCCLDVILVARYRLRAAAPEQLGPLHLAVGSNKEAARISAFDVGQGALLRIHRLGACSRTFDA